ncbi:LysM-like peptidoglycan-binding domain-containing protein [Enterovibrio norvegicus]|uniref:LysM-like peptidoglycan-binding domain-containing protein n=1 Tax=Enterovibrio norvegicus TaxID=188144 RepID=UPI00352D4E0B
MTLKGKREKGQAATLPMGDAVKAAIEKAMATIKPYFARVTPYWDALPKPHRIGVSVLAGLLVVLLLWPSSDDNAAVPETTANGERVALPLTFENQDPAEDDGFNQNGSEVVSTQTVSQRNANTPQNVNTDWVNYEVARGDTLSNIFRQQDLPLPDLYAISSIEGDDKPLSRIQPGQLLRFKRDSQGELDMIQIEVSKDTSVIFFRLSDGSFARRK